ncbi:MAG TPA: UvrD-helicase domain-containing protein [Acidimicrobiales bacterium]
MRRLDPSDALVRELVTSQLDDTLFLEASAGTGKTTLLVDRVVGLVLTGRARIEQIAAITFTEAAAAELRDRLAQRFEELALEDPSGRAAVAAAGLDGAAVTTLHGFARRILAEHPLEAGLPPVFDVVDASSSRAAFDERWERLVDAFGHDPAHNALIARALCCGMSWTRLRLLALACEENWERLPECSAPGPAPLISSTHLLDRLHQALELAPLCRDPEDRLARFLREEIATATELIEGAEDDLDLLQVLTGLRDLSPGRRGRQEVWRRPDGTCAKADTGGLLASAQAERQRLLDSTTRWVLETLASHLTRFTLAAAEDRRRRGHLMFHDLLVLARRLLRDRPAVRLELHTGYTHLLIDEFQDSDPLQVDLALLLTSPPTDDPDERIEPSPGRLFLVGDPKQSIYRFRRADIDLFMRTQATVGRSLRLSTNFRSRPAIVSWVNTVFAELFGTGVPGGQPPYEAIDAFAECGHDNPRQLVPVLVVGRQPVVGPAATVRAVQAADVVGTILTMQQEEWPIGPDGHAMRFSDVAVLIRSRTALSALEAAFAEAGVPYRLESSSLVYQAQEVQDLLSLLRAIDDPTDSVSVLAALRSPALGCADDELAAHRAAGGTWDPRRPGPPGPVRDALAVLEEAHRHRWWMSVTDLISTVVADRRLMGLALSGRRPRESWRRIHFVVDQSRRFDQSQGGDLRGFLRWIDHQQADGARAMEVVLPESDDDAVRISTMHAAKGLEFPVTVLVGLKEAPASDRPPLLFDDDGAQLCLASGFESPGYGAALARERELDRFEQRRLLYVGATRARDVLIVSVHRSVTSKDQLVADLLAACDAHPDQWIDGAELCAPGLAPAAGPATGSPPALFDDREVVAGRRSRLLEAAATARTVSATAIRKLGAGGMGDDVEDADEGEPVRDAGTGGRGRTGTAVGRAVHAVLAEIDLATGHDLAARCQAAAVTEGIAGRTGEIRALVQVALTSGVIQRAVASGKYWREVYVGVPIGDRVLEGFVDLVIETAEGLVVVDYKTDRSSPDQSEQVAERYRLQGAAYALGLERSLGRPVSACIFLLLGAEQAYEVELSDLPAAVAEVEKLLLGDVA